MDEENVTTKKSNNVILKIVLIVVLVLVLFIVGLAIIGVIGGHAIMGRVNTARNTSFINTYNDVKKELSNKIILKEDTCAISEGEMDTHMCAEVYDLSSSDYNLSILDQDGSYKITLEATKGGAYENIDLTKIDNCIKSTNAKCYKNKIVGTISE